MKTVGDARQWLTENLTGRDPGHELFYAQVRGHVAGLPDDDRELARAVAMLTAHEDKPWPRPAIMLSETGEDSADVLGEVLDEDEMARASRDDYAETKAAGFDPDPGDEPVLSRASCAAFVHDWLSQAQAWLAVDASE
jgi:hypothetical protein